MFSLKCWILFWQQTHKTHSYYHLVTAEPPFILTRIDRMHQTRPRKGVQHATVCYYTFTVNQVCQESVAVSKVRSRSLLSLKWKVYEQYWGDILLSQQMLAVIKHVVDDNIICLSATQLMHAPVHGSCNTVQQLLSKTLNFISLMLWPKQARAELNWLQDLEPIAAWI